MQAPEPWCLVLGIASTVHTVLMIWGGLWEIIFPSCWETTGNTGLAHRLFLLVLGYSLLVLSLVLLLVTSKNFHSKEIDAAKVCRWDQSSNSATEIFYYVDPSGAVVCATHNTSNVKKHLNITTGLRCPGNQCKIGHLIYGSLSRPRGCFIMLPSTDTLLCLL